MPSPSRLNGVGYNTTANIDEYSSIIFGASFNDIANPGVIPFTALNCPEGFEDEDQIQTPYTDERGVTKMHVYWYFGEWLDEEYNPVEENAGIALGKAAWFLSSSAKHITTSGEVKKGNHIHTFTESSELVTSAFPVAFCPNSENVSWGVSDESQIQTAYTDERGVTKMHVYWYFGEWLDEEYNTLDPEVSVAGPGDGFWLLLSDASETFTEVCPLTE